jgi:hypothetical protein
MNRRDYGWIALAELVNVHPAQLREHSTEWLCRAKEQLGWRIDAFASVAKPVTAESDALLARLMRARTVVEAELDERLARTLTDLPNLIELHRQGYRHPGRTL